MLRGEEIVVTESYDLFGLDVKGESGIFLKLDKETGKNLIYFPVNGEWGELLETQFKRTSPGSVSDNNKEFVSRIQTMKITFPT